MKNIIDVDKFVLDIRLDPIYRNYQKDAEAVLAGDHIFNNGLPFIEGIKAKNLNETFKYLHQHKNYEEMLHELAVKMNELKTSVEIPIQKEWTEDIKKKVIADYVSKNFIRYILYDRMIMVQQQQTNAPEVGPKPPTEAPDGLSSFFKALGFVVLIIFIISFVLYAVNTIINIILFLIMKKKNISFWYIFAGPIGTYYYL